MANQTVQFIDINTIQTNPFQPRGKIQTDELKDLASSIKEHGILEPLVIAHTPAGYQIIAGERRWRAAKLAGLSEVPALIKKTTPRGMLELAIIENVQRVDLNSIERAKAFSQLMKDFSYSVGEVAQKIGKSSSYVSNSLRLLALPDAIKDGLAGGLISEGHARALASVDNVKDMIGIYKQLLKENASVRRAEELVRYYKDRVQNTQTKAIKKVVSQVDPQIVKRWQKEFGRVLRTKPQLKLSRSKNHTRLILTLKGDPEEAKKDIEKIVELVENQS